MSKTVFSTHRKIVLQINLTEPSYVIEQQIRNQFRNKIRLLVTTTGWCQIVPCL